MNQTIERKIVGKSGNTYTVPRRTKTLLDKVVQLLR